MSTTDVKIRVSIETKSTPQIQIGEVTAVQDQSITPVSFSTDRTAAAKTESGMILLFLIFTVNELFMLLVFSVLNYYSLDFSALFANQSMPYV
jgi:hypothetical protein